MCSISRTCHIKKVKCIRDVGTPKLVKCHCHEKGSMGVQRLTSTPTDNIQTL